MEGKELTNRVMGDSLFLEICGKTCSGKIISAANSYAKHKGIWDITNKDLVEFYNYIEQSGSNQKRLIELTNGYNYGKKSQKLLKDYLKEKKLIN